MAVGQYLKEAREAKGWSAREAARRLAVSATRIAEVESGRSRTTGKPTTPGVDFLIKASKGYELPLPVLLEMAGLTNVSADERQEAELIKLWREVGPKNRELAIALLRAMKAQLELS